MTAAEEAHRTVGDDLDEPARAHMAEGNVFEGGDMFTALCGARLIGVKADHDALKCEKCEDEIHRLLGGK